ncbi:hypothetical protein QBC47DRAFT_391391 [Echria macrotheca]|uniref:Secreted protein n=1 Tax=Echria macrotheca TaxID=438768 RepID=A0AAJ0B7N2_9PEZI|nr:hypothetical protein QBC47DRAFT_391391 [Echria macrotheca]
MRAFHLVWVLLPGPTAGRSCEFIPYTHGMDLAFWLFSWAECKKTLLLPHPSPSAMDMNSPYVFNAKLPSHPHGENTRLKEQTKSVRDFYRLGNPRPLTTSKTNAGIPTP